MSCCSIKCSAVAVAIVAVGLRLAVFLLTDPGDPAQQPVPLPLSWPSGSGASKLVLVTGGTDGVGYHTAVELAKVGCSVIITSRSREKAIAKAAEIEAKAAQGRGAVYGVALDLQSFDSVRACAAEVQALGPALHALVHNAGGVDGNHPTNAADGLEWDYTGRVASMHLLTSLLWGLLKEAGNGEFGPSRVMVTIGPAIGFFLDVPSVEFKEWLRNDVAGELEGKTCPLGWTHGPNQIKQAVTVLTGSSAWVRALAAKAEETSTPVKFLLTQPGLAAGTGMVAPSAEPILNILGIGAHHASQACLSNVAAVLAQSASLPNGCLVGSMHHAYGPPGMFDFTKHDVHRKWKCISGQGAVAAGNMVLKEVERKTNAAIAF